MHSDAEIVLRAAGDGHVLPHLSPRIFRLDMFPYLLKDLGHFPPSMNELVNKCWLNGYAAHMTKQLKQTRMELKARCRAV